MTTFQTRHLNRIVESETIPPRYIAYYRRNNRNRIFTAILKLYTDLHKQGKINQKKLAKRIGKNPSVINRWLAEAQNLTLDSVSDLLLAMNAEIKEFVPIYIFDWRPTRPVGRSLEISWTIESSKEANNFIEKVRPLSTLPHAASTQSSSVNLGTTSG